MEDFTGDELIQAAIYNDDELMTCLLQGECAKFIDKQDRRGRTPVYTAVSNNSAKCLRVLLENGANPNIPAGEHFHRMTSQVECILRVCDFTRIPEFQTPLHCAVIDVKFSLFKILLEFDADYTIEDASGLTPIHVAENMELPQFVELFEEEQEKREQILDVVLREFVQACQEEDVDKMRSILDRKHTPTFHCKLVSNAVTEDGLTPLCWAAKCGNTAMMELLIQHKASVIYCTQEESRPIHFACHFEHKECVRLLLEKWPDMVCTKMISEKLPLHVAIETGSLSIVKLLLEFPYPAHALEDFKDELKSLTYKMPFDINAKDSIGSTPLFRAVERNCADIVRYLLQFSVKCEKKRQRKPTEGRSRQDSFFSFTPPVVKTTSRTLFEEENQSKTYKPVDINIQCRNGFTALHMAVSSSFYEITDILLKNKADVNIAANENGKTISTLTMACKKGDSIILDKLFRYGADDLDKEVFNYAASQRPRMIFTLLKYRTFKDLENEYKINKQHMKQQYFQMNEQEDDINGLNSLTLDFRKKFPVNPVHIKWQDLQHLETIKEESLIDIGCHHNPDIQGSINNPFALYAITKIDISGNKLGSMFPSVLFKLPSLHSLNLSKNKLHTFPKTPPFELDSIFVCLEELILDSNYIEALPDYLFSPHISLRNLSVSNNKLTEIPAEIWDMPMLAYLNLSKNSIRSLPQPKLSYQQNNMRDNGPSTFHDLPSDNESETSNSKVNETEVKHAVTWMHATTGVSVVHNEFDSSSSHNSRGLQDLNLSKNKISEVPFWICCTSPHLESLNLSSNEISSVGKIFNYPQHLKTLDLSNNRVADMLSWQKEDDGSDICYSKRIPTRLTGSPRPGSYDRTSSPSFSSSYTSFTQIISCTHRQHKILERLDTLNLSGNKGLRKIVITKSESQSAKRYASRNSLTPNLDEEKGRLLFPNLTSLDMSYNINMVEIPPEIGDLSSLKRLALSCTGIRELPPAIGKLKNLFTLEIERCNLEGPIQDIIHGSPMRTRDILGFLLSVLEEAEEYNCMNLMFVGVHNIGKTLLLQQIRKHGKCTQKVTHFGERIDQESSSYRHDGGTLSTVGIDINEIVIGERKTHGPVTFRTWDFGGQKEYYATHQYFLSPRSLYLVMWKLTDGEQGIQTIWQWLVSIQARAPGSPVIIVGTHRDVLTNRRTSKNYPPSFEDEMKSLISKLFIRVEEPEKCGLPLVIGQFNVSSTKGDNVRELVNFIYDRVFELKHPRRNKEKLLQHKIPKKYLILKDIVHELAEERIREKKDPVLDKSSYMLKTMHKMMERSGTVFRDPEDVEQATRFLHENGILFHYEDLLLKDRYFLNPQWLCDQLARVVTVDQVNNFAQNGVMKADNLHVLFKKSSFQPENIEHYICGLLAKFEVALEYDRQHLLIPSLLPREQDMSICIKRKEDVKIPLYRFSPQDGRPCTSSYNSSNSSRIRLTYLKCTATSNVTFSNCRLYVMTYFPSGFWPRLITRILADESMYETVQGLFPIPSDILNGCPNLRMKEPHWQPWQTGMQLLHYDTILFRLKEILPGSSGFCNYQHADLKCWIENEWSSIDMFNSVVLEMGYPCDSITFTFADHSSSSQQYAMAHKEQIFLNEKFSAKFIAKISEHVDNLLQDWYPEIGESRFVQNCYGRYLITRILPCPHCLYGTVKKERKTDKSMDWQCINQDLDVTSTFELSDEQDFDRRQSLKSAAPMQQTEGIYCFLVEKCILNFLNNYDEICPRHGVVSPTYMMSHDGIARILYIAPDVVFNDLDNDILISQSDCLNLEKCIGKGAFGEVFQGKLIRVEEPSKDVAVKLLFGPFKDPSLQSKGQTHLHLENATMAYLTARQEVSILQKIRHDHMVPLLGLATRPLALVLSLAPLGSLGDKLLQIGKDGRRLGVFTIKQIIIQVADALSYLHDEVSIIYRDLKADNVLIWQMNTSDFSEDNLDSIIVKIADYGISRSIHSSGTKGFGGTPPFIAPEILQFAGKSQYTEKVDIFSFGMFVYELLTCKKPLEDVTNPTLFICQNGRPSISRRELHYPAHFLDLMMICWSHDPADRPSAECVKQIAASPQFCHFADAVSLDTSVNILSACCVCNEVSSSEDNEEVFEDFDYQCDYTRDIWLSTMPTNQTSRIEIYSYDKYCRCTINKTIPLHGCSLYGLVSVDSRVWAVDSQANVHIYSSMNIEEEKVIKTDIDVSGLKFLTSRCLTVNKEAKIIFLLSSVKSGLLNILEVDAHSRSVSTRHVSVPGKCISACLVDSAERIEIWCGQTEGKIQMLEYNDLNKPGQYLQNSSVVGTNLSCLFLESAYVEDKQFMWTYNYPGTVVSRWDTERQTIDEELNCSDVVPITDSGSVFYFGSYEACKYQVTAMKVFKKYIYIGTTSGCIIVADALRMKPHTVFCCHSSEDFYVRLIVPFQDSSSEDRFDLNKTHGIITVGKGYRDVTRQNKEQDSDSASSSISYQRTTQRAVKNPTFILSWYARNWEFY